MSENPLTQVLTPAARMKLLEEAGISDAAYAAAENGFLDVAEGIPVSDATMIGILSEEFDVNVLSILQSL